MKKNLIIPFLLLFIFCLTGCGNTKIKTIQSNKRNATVDQIEVITDYINIRLEKSVESDLLGKVYKGEIYSILSIDDSSYKWIEINTENNIHGYISGKDEYVKIIYSRDDNVNEKVQNNEVDNTENISSNQNSNTNDNITNNKCKVTDNEGPNYTITSITPNPVKLGENVTITLTASDESGVASVEVQLVNTVGNVAGGSLKLISGDKISGTYSGTFRLPTDTPIGEWKANIYARDTCGHYGNTFTTKTFTVTGNITDNEGPNYTITSITPNPVKLGENVTITLTASDESEVASVEVQLVNTVGNVAGGSLKLISGDKISGIYSGTFRLPTDTPIGEWKANIYARDIYGHYGNTFTTKTFTVTGNITDNEGPNYTITSITPNPVKLGENVTITLTANDESGVASVEVQLVNTVGNVAGGSLKLISGDKISGTYSGTFRLPTDTPIGEWKANIYARDIYGHYGNSFTIKTFTVTE